MEQLVLESVPCQAIETIAHIQRIYNTIFKKI